MSLSESRNPEWYYTIIHFKNPIALNAWKLATSYWQLQTVIGREGGERDGGLQNPEKEWVVLLPLQFESLLSLLQGIGLHTAQIRKIPT